MGILGDIADTISERLNPATIASEMEAGAAKMVSQGAAELGQALFTGNAYMPYGPTEASIPMADTAPAMDTAPVNDTAPVVDTAPVQAPEVQETAPIEPSQGYEQMLDSYAPPTAPEMQQEVEMER